MLKSRLILRYIQNLKYTSMGNQYSFLASYAQNLKSVRVTVVMLTQLYYSTFTEHIMYTLYMVKHIK